MTRRCYKAEFSMKDDTTMGPCLKFQCLHTQYKNILIGRTPKLGTNNCLLIAMMQ